MSAWKAQIPSDKFRVSRLHFHRNTDKRHPKISWVFPVDCESVFQTQRQASAAWRWWLLQPADTLLNDCSLAGLALKSADTDFQSAEDG